MQEVSASHVIVGGGSAGCVMAARLSEVSGNTVVLFEAGIDYAPDKTPSDISERYGGRAFGNLAYFWPGLAATRGSHDRIPAAARRVPLLHQARVIGGGSSINAQVALRGISADYDRWVQSGATGWSWEEVLPYFKKVERDLDFDNELHGQDGPLPIKRSARDEWDQFNRAASSFWARKGHTELEDLNGEFQDGFGPTPFSNDGVARWSAARAYLSAAVRSRTNLRIISQTTVQRIEFDGKRAVAIRGTMRGAPFRASASVIVLTAGAVHTPKLLMLSGLGPANHLRTVGITPILDRPGIGANLQDHPTIYVSAHLKREVRQSATYRGPATYMRYSSNLSGCTQSDMMIMATGRSGWHSVGEHIATVIPFVATPFSRGNIKLASADPNENPFIDLNYLAEDRDRIRLIEGFRLAALTMLSNEVRATTSNAFPTAYSKRVIALAEPSRRNRLLTDLIATLLDSNSLVRSFLIDNFITSGPRLATLMQDDEALEDFVTRTVSPIWHVCGTCQMGLPSEPMSVTTPQGKVIGTENLFIADASIMPLVPAANTNLPVLMTAERIADDVKARRS